jgi:hypothetical protein
LLATRRLTAKVPCEVFNAVDVTANRAGRWSSFSII